MGTVNMELKVVVGLLLVAGVAQATPANGYRSRRQIEAKCECREKINELDRSIGNCTTDRKDFFVTTGNGKVVLKDKVGSNYFCTVDGDSNCPDKQLYQGSKDQYISYKACQYFVPKPADFPQKHTIGCGPEGVDFPWKKFNKNCYMLVEKKATWEEARKKCKNHSAHLASINSEEENEFLVGMIKSKDLPEESFWVGGKRDCDGCDEFSWTDESQWRFQDFEDGVSTSRFPGRLRTSDSISFSPPVGLPLQKNCVLAGPKWKAAHCQEAKRFFCEY